MDKTACDCDDEKMNAEDNSELELSVKKKIPYPVRQGQPDCAFFMRTGLCCFGHKCKFNHPPDRLTLANLQDQFPERHGQPHCKFFVKTGKCKFGSTCKFHHPIDLRQLQHSNSNSASTSTAATSTHGNDNLDLEDNNEEHQRKDSMNHDDQSNQKLISSSNSNNNKGSNIDMLPLNPGQKDCSFYLRSGRCKYGTACKFNHPPNPRMHSPPITSHSSAYAYFPNAAASTSMVPLPPNNHHHYHSQINNIQLLQWPLLPHLHHYYYHHLYSSCCSTTTSTSLLHHPNLNYNIPFCSNFNPLHHHRIPPISSPSPYHHLLLQRPGHALCSYFLRTGHCRFGISCKFHHPCHCPPSRPGAPPCVFYAKHGYCKYGEVCKFDHPLHPSVNIT